MSRTVHPFTSRKFRNTTIPATWAMTQPAKSARVTRSISGRSRKPRPAPPVARNRQQVARAGSVSLGPRRETSPLLLPSKSPKLLAAQIAGPGTGEIGWYEPTFRLIAWFELEIVGQAMDRHTVSPCAGCDGPRIHSRWRGILCVGCGMVWDITSRVAPRKCNRCQRRVEVNRKDRRCVKCAMGAVGAGKGPLKSGPRQYAAPWYHPALYRYIGGP